jgi:cation:H+ antiporter
MPRWAIRGDLPPRNSGPGALWSYLKHGIGWQAGARRSLDKPRTVPAAVESSLFFMLPDILLFCFGLLILYFGAEALVSGASALAMSIGVRPLVIGCTIVAFGTSAPELTVSLSAVLDGRHSISLGNIIGSNIANLALILGVAAVIRPIEISSDVIRREYPAMLSSCLLLILLSVDGELSPSDGGILLVSMLGYLTYLALVSRGDEADMGPDTDDDPGRLGNGAKVALGIVGLGFGASWMVESAVSLAAVLGVSEVIVGITIVALGTSLPELATSVVAALRGQSDLSVGNVIGSNVFNSLLVLGVVASMGGLTVESVVIRYDLWMMLLVSIIVWPLMRHRMSLHALHGIALVTIYLTYMIWLFLR